MKTPAILIALLLCSIVYAHAPGSFEPLYALSGGTWQMKTKKGYICERWKKISDNELHSQGFKVTGTDTILQEKVRLVQKSDGIYYIPTVIDQNKGEEVSFKLISFVDKEYIFSNPDHDFPQRVIYHLVSQDSIHAWVDGQYKGKYVKQDFYYKRVKN